MSSRQRVLSLYRRVLRTARGWEGGQQEQRYIVREAKQQFSKHKGLTNSQDIETKLTEGEQRLELGKHYKNPYPRLHHAEQFKRRTYKEPPIIK
eukprot:jgi/Chrzof1/9094/Cz03g35250.t1